MPIRWETRTLHYLRTLLTSVGGSLRATLIRMKLPYSVLCRTSLATSLILCGASLTVACGDDNDVTNDVGVGADASASNGDDDGASSDNDAGASNGDDDSDDDDDDADPPDTSTDDAAAADAGPQPAPGDAGSADAAVSVDAGPIDCEFSDNLLAWWTAEGNSENAVDGTEAAFNGTYAEGQVGQGFNLDGQSQFAELAEFSAPPTGITVDAWVKVNSLSNGTQFIASWWSDSEISFALALSRADLSAFGNCSADAGPAAFFRVETAAGFAVACTSTTIEDGNFHHIAGSHDVATGTVSIYVDGVKQGEAELDAGAVMQTNTGNVRLGARDTENASPLFFSGVLDEVDVFAGALSDAEVQALAAGNTDPKCE